MADSPNKPTRPFRSYPVSPGKVKVLAAVPERTYDKLTTLETRLVGPNIGPRYTSGWIDLVRYRDAAGGPELDPTEEPIRLDIPDLDGMAARMPEAAALIDAFDAFVVALGKEQGVF